MNAPFARIVLKLLHKQEIMPQGNGAARTVYRHSIKKAHHAYGDLEIQQSS